MIRESLLERNPELGPVTVPLLIGLANAIEREAVQRYETLAQSMERRGELATAAAFRVMLDEERAHVSEVERWAASLHEIVPDAAQFAWRLPSDLSTSWAEVAGSARLTPYRAFSIAVDNEQRAFALYSYLAASAADSAAATQAEHLALEELRHASLMRRWRRQAFHRERRALREPEPVVTSARALHELLAAREAVIVACHRAIAARLVEIGDRESAGLLERLAETPSWSPEGSAAHGVEVPANRDPVHLLTAAQEPLEALSEVLEAVMRTTEGELFAEVELAFASVVARISRISLQAGRRMHAR